MISIKKNILKGCFLVLFSCFLISCSDADNIYYEIKGDEVLYHSVYRKGQEYYTKAHTTVEVVEGADASSFQQLTKYYGIDKSSVFNKARKLIKRDPETFKVLNKLVTADKYGTYYDNNIIPNSDGLSFRFINNNYAIDDNQIYYMPTNLSRVIKDGDKATFTAIGDSFSDYAKDKNQIYYRGVVIEDAKPNSFKPLANGFSKDSVAIFFKKDRLDEADYGSFKILSNEAKQVNDYKYVAEDDKNRYNIIGENLVINKKNELENDTYD